MSEAYDPCTPTPFKPKLVPKTAAKAAAAKITKLKPDEPASMLSPEETGENASQTVATGQLRAFIERVERLEEDKVAIADDIKEVFAEMKGTGFDTKAVRTIIKMRKQDVAKRHEFESILQLYMNALGMS